MSLVLTTALALLALSAAPDESPIKVGDTAPAFTMKTVNAEVSNVKMLTLGKHVGDKPAEPKTAVVLSFGASYCEPCKKELGELKALEPRLTKAGVLLAVVVIDTEPDGIELMRKLTVETLKLPYPVVSDRYGVLARRYGAHALPYMVIVDKTGNVQYIHSGFAPGTLDELTKTLGI